MSSLLTIATGSKGNSYILSDNDGKELILDAGIKSRKIKEALGYNFLNVEGVLITHNHSDHSLCADELESFGLDVFRPYTLDDGMDRITLGKYAVSSFPVHHENEPCVGFVINHVDGFRMLYATDLSYTKYTFKNMRLDCILVECNYMEEYISPTMNYLAHKVLGHFSLKNCKEFIKVNQTDNLKNVILCHMGFSTCDENECISQIREVVGDGVNVYLATPGERIEL